MTIRKNVVLVFSKLPEAGRVKTRLTAPEGGLLSPEAAASLYHCMLLDVVHAILAAFDELEAQTPAPAQPQTGIDSAALPDVVRDSYQLVVSTTPGTHVPLMRGLLERAGLPTSRFEVIADEGASFAEHYDHAFERCFDLGADCVLSLRGDLPALTKADIRRGFELLHSLDGQPPGGLVLAPNQSAGVSLVGWTRETEFSHAEVFAHWNAFGVLPAYIHRAADRGLPVLLLPPVPDVDTVDDLRHSAAFVQALCYSAEFRDDPCPPWRTAAALYQMGLRDVLVKPQASG